MKIGIAVTLVIVILAIALPLTVRGKDSDLEDEELQGAIYMQKLDQEMARRRNLETIADWAYGSNITDHNQEVKLNVSLEIAKLDKISWEETVSFKWQNFQDYDLKRKFKRYSILGSAALPDDKLTQLKNSIAEMEGNYATSKICSYKDKTKCNLSLEPEITEIFTKSKDPEELKDAWLQWHKEAGAKVKKSYIDYVTLSNEASKLNNFTDYAQSWLSEYEQDDFEAEMGKIWEQIKPLYLQIHAYVRKRLWDKYGDTVINRKGPIPAHLLGNVWAQQWSNVEEFSRPYPDKPEIDATPGMIAQNYTPLKMFQMADEFFQSINLTAMPEEFWKNSIIEKPKDGRELVCHASAWDFFDGKDFRIKMCTVVNSVDFETVHHEMGHVQYYLQYKHLPDIYKAGANPGFHEAVGDVISLSVSTPKHLRKIGLLPEEADDAQTEINHLYSKGIEKIVFLPFAYLLDVYRYAIFRGETQPEDYNCHFWNLRESLQGLEPPTTRTEDDFDAAAKYHVSADVEYARYYVSFVIQFQFHRALCQKAGEFVPGDETKKLTSCDIYQSTEAGNALGKMLQMGNSRPWQDAMELLTGQRNMDASGLLDYFQPLKEWLEQENNRTGEHIGWESSKVQFCTESQRDALNLKLKAKPDSLNK